MMIKNRSAQKIFAVLLILTFSFSNIVWSSPMGIVPVGDFKNIHTQDGIDIPSLAKIIEVPESLGVIRQRFIADAPGSREPSSTPKNLSPVIVHIQDAHANVEAQQNIKNILEHLTRAYQLDAIFLEGSLQGVDQNLLKNFTEDARNQKIADQLAKEGLVGGTELFLIENQNRQIPVYGVEDPDLYRSNLEAFRTVMKDKEASDQYLDQMKQGIFSLSSHIFDNKLRSFFKEWLFYQDVPGELMRHLNGLRKYSKEELKIDFEDARVQKDWPELVRIFKLQTLEPQVNANKVEAERKSLEKWLREKKIENIYIENINNVLRGKALKGSKYLDPRRFIERFYDEVSPYGFSFKDFPELSKALGVSVLKSELDARLLFSEINRVTDRLLDHMADGPSGKSLIAIYRDYLRLKKLLSLELVQEDYLQVLQRKDDLKPSRLSERLENIRATAAKEVKGLNQNQVKLKFSDQTFEKALAFYAGAQARDKSIYENMISKMKDHKKANAILITGGFHAEGLSSQFKANSVSFLQVTPRISEMEESQNYLNVMTLKGDYLTRRSYVNHASLAENGGFASLENHLGRETAFHYAGVENAIVGSEIANMVQAGIPFAQAVDQIMNSPAAKAGGLNFARVPSENLAVAIINGQPIPQGKGENYLAISSKGPAIVNADKLPADVRSEIRAGKAIELTHVSTTRRDFFRGLTAVGLGLLMPERTEAQEFLPFARPFEPEPIARPSEATYKWYINMTTLRAQLLHPETARIDELSGEADTIKGRVYNLATLGFHLNKPSLGSVNFTAGDAAAIVDAAVKLAQEGKNDDILTVRQLTKRLELWHLVRRAAEDVVNDGVTFNPAYNYPLGTGDISYFIDLIEKGEITPRPKMGYNQTALNSQSALRERIREHFRAQQEAQRKLEGQPFPAPENLVILSNRQVKQRRGESKIQALVKKFRLDVPAKYTEAFTVGDVSFWEEQVQSPEVGFGEVSAEFYLRNRIRMYAEKTERKMSKEDVTVLVAQAKDKPLQERDKFLRGEFGVVARSEVRRYNKSRRLIYEIPEDRLFLSTVTGSETPFDDEIHHLSGSSFTTGARIAGEIRQISALHAAATDRAFNQMAAENVAPVLTVMGQANYTPGSTVRLVATATDQDVGDTVNVDLDRDGTGQTVDGVFYTKPGDSREYLVSEDQFSFDKATGVFTWHLPADIDLNNRYYVRFVAGSTMAEGGYGGVDIETVEIKVVASIIPAELLSPNGYYRVTYANGVLHASKERSGKFQDITVDEEGVSLVNYTVTNEWLNYIVNDHGAVKIYQLPLGNIGTVTPNNPWSVTLPSGIVPKDAASIVLIPQTMLAEVSDQEGFTYRLYLYSNAQMIVTGAEQDTPDLAHRVVQDQVRPNVIYVIDQVTRDFNYNRANVTVFVIPEGTVESGLAAVTNTSFKIRVNGSERVISFDQAAASDLKRKDLPQIVIYDYTVIDQIILDMGNIRTDHNLDRLLTEAAPEVSKEALQFPEGLYQPQYFVTRSSDGKLAIAYSGEIHHYETRTVILSGGSEYTYSQLVSINPVGGIVYYNKGMGQEPMRSTISPVFGIGFTAENELVYKQNYGSHGVLDSLDSNNRIRTFVKEVLFSLPGMDETTGSAISGFEGIKAENADYRIAASGDNTIYIKPLRPELGEMTEFSLPTPWPLADVRDYSVASARFLRTNIVEVTLHNGEVRYLALSAPETGASDQRVQVSAEVGVITPNGETLVTYNEDDHVFVTRNLATGESVVSDHHYLLNMLPPMASNSAAVFAQANSNFVYIVTLEGPAAGSVNWLQIPIPQGTQDYSQYYPVSVKIQDNLAVLVLKNGKLAVIDLNPYLSPRYPVTFTTSVASNAEYSYAVRNVPGSATSEVYGVFKNDGTRVATFTKTMYLGPSSSSAVGVPDVSSDGKYAIIGMQSRSLYTGHDLHFLTIAIANLQTGEILTSIAVQSTDNQELRIPTDIRMAPDSARVVRVTYSASEFVDYDIELPSVPAGWTRAASNPYYAFTIKLDETQQNGYLYVMNLQTSQEMKVGGGSRVRHYPSRYDVSPDGRVVVVGYHEAGPVVGDLSRIGMYRMEELVANEQNFISATLNPSVARNISFANGNIIVDVTVRGPNYYPNGTDTVDKTFSIPESAITNIPYQGEFKRAVTDDGQYAILFDAFRTGLVTTFKVSVFDIAAGKLLGKANYTHNANPIYSSDPEYENGLNYQFDAASFKMTTVVNNQVLTLQINREPPPVPEGWTRTASNVNFAFQVSSSYVANGIYNITVKVLNLQTSQEQVISSGQSTPYAHPTGPYDVSPDGTTVVYGYQGPYSPYGVPQYVIMEHLANLSEQVQLEGRLASVQFADGNATAVTTGEPVNPRYQVNLADLATDETTYILANPDADTVTYQEDAKLVAYVKTVTTTKRIQIFDTTNGTDHMNLLFDRLATTGFPTDQVTLVDVYQTPAGKGVVSYTADTYAPSEIYDYKTYVVDPRAGNELVLDGRATSVTYDGAIAHYEIIHRNGATGAVDVNLETLKEISLPAGWTRAASNPYYAFQIVAQRPSTSILKLMDLRSGAEQILTTVDEASGGNQTISQFRDVSPDGTTVVYGINAPAHFSGGRIYVKSIADLSRGTDYWGTLQSISFDAANVTTEAASAKLTGLIDSVVIQMSDYQKVDEYSRIKPNYPSLVIDQDTPLLVAMTRNYVSGEFQVLVYDASQGADRLRYLTTVGMFSDSTAVTSFQDAVTIPSGTQIVSVGIDGDHANKSVVLNPRSGQKLVLEGAITEARYDGAIGVYTVRSQEGVNREVMVNLETLQEITVPAGWTRAASNVNFAYQIESKNWHGSEWEVTAKVMDLRTSQQYKLNVVTNEGQRIKDYDSAVVDVNQEGTYAIATAKDTHQGEYKIGYIFASNEYGPVALSNESFMYVYEAVKLVNLKTGERYTVTPTTEVTPDRYYYFSDVSENGTYVVMVNLQHFLGPKGIYSYFQKIGESSMWYQVSGYMQGVDFKTGDVATGWINFIPNLQKNIEVDVPSKTETVIDYGIINPEIHNYVLRGNTVTLHNQGVTYTFDATNGLDHMTLESALIDVPAGWTRAASNPYYAYRTTYRRVTPAMDETKLWLRDLRTGVEKQLASVYTGYGPIGNIVDVSPENTPGGPVVIYEVGGPNRGGVATRDIFVRRVQNLENKAVIQDQVFNERNVLRAIVFNPNGTAALRMIDRFFDGTEIQDSYEIALGDLTVSSPVVTVLNQGSEFFYDNNTKLAVLTMPSGQARVQLSNGQWSEATIHARVYDATNGLDQMTSLKPVVFEDGQNVPYRRFSEKVLSTYVTPSGRKIVSMGIKIEASSDWRITNPVVIRMTKIVDVVTGQELKLNRNIKSANFSGNLGVYTVDNPNGGYSRIVVNLNTLKIDREYVYNANNRITQRINYTNGVITAIAYLNPANGYVVNQQLFNAKTGIMYYQALRDATTNKLLDVVQNNPVTGIIQSEQAYDVRTGKITRYDRYDSKGALVKSTLYNPVTGKIAYQNKVVQVSPPPAWIFNNAAKKITINKREYDANNVLIRQIVSDGRNAATLRVTTYENGKLKEVSLYDMRTKKRTRYDVYESGELVQSTTYHPITGRITKVLTWPKLSVRSEVRGLIDVSEEALLAYFAALGVTEEAVIRTAKDVAERTISEEHRVRPEIYEALIKAVAPVIAKEAQMDVAQVRNEIEKSIADVKTLIASKALILDGRGIALLTTSGDLNQRKNLTLAALPILAALAKQDSKGEYIQSVILSGEHVAAIKRAVYGKDANLLTANEKALVSKVVKFADGHVAFADLIHDQLLKQSKNPAPRALVSSMTEDELSQMPEIVKQILNSIENPTDLSSKKGSIVQKAEAYVVRALLLIDLASRIQLNAEKLKTQPDYLKQVVVLIRQFFEERLPDIAVAVNEDGSFRLTLAEISKQLAILKAAEQARAKSA